MTKTANISSGNHTGKTVSDAFKGQTYIYLGKGVKFISGGYMLSGIRPLFSDPTGRILSRWFRSSSTSESFSLSQEQQDLELGESLNELLLSDITRFSFMSTDSGIERDLPPSAEPSLEATGLSASWEPCKR